MENLGMDLLMLFTLSGTVAVEGLYTTRILTEPSQGPFRMERQVLFSCQIEPLPPAPVTYQWRYLEDRFGGRSTGQNITRTYYEMSLHYCYYYCEVLMNGSLVGSASRIIELQGYVYTDNPVVRSFNRGENLMLNVSISDEYGARYIAAIAWYHNGTKIVSGNKYIIWNTTLRINDMVENDTGIYEAKIALIDFGRNSPECDTLVLPLLEAQAAYAPVTFLVQEQHVPVYDVHVSSIVSTHYVANDTDDYSIRRIELNVAVPLSSQLLRFISYNWYMNGIEVTTGGSQEGLSVAYNNTATIIGDYVGIYSARIVNKCEGYYILFRHLQQGPFRQVILPLSFWKIKYSRPPSSVVLHFGEPILTGFETTTVECSAVGGESVEAYNLTLWRNEELLAHVNGSHLSHMTTPYQYGAYRCSVDSIHETAILMERVSFQLLFIGTTLCEQNQLGDDMKIAISGLLGSLCQSCDNIHASSIVDAELNCTLESAYLTAGIVYSTFDGRLTASTLVTRLHVWLLSQDTPSILLGDTAMEVNKQCPTQVDATTNSCFGLDGTMAEHMVTNSSPHFLVGFFSGVATGVVATALLVAIVICSIRFRASGCQLFSKADDKSSEIPVGINQAYVSTSVPGSAGKIQEAIYELP